MSKIKIIRAVTAAQSVGFFLGLIPELKEMGYDVVALSSDGPGLQRVQDAGGRAIAVEMQRRMSPLKDLKSLWQMIKVFRKEKPTMVHSMTPKAGLLCMIAAWLTRVPVRIHTFTGLVFPTANGFTQKILILTDRITCACATHIIPEGEGVKSDLINYKITKKDLKVLGHGNVKGIDLNYFDPNIPSIQTEAKMLRKEGIVTFVFVGRLVGDKGINELIEAFEQLNIKYPNTRLLLVGRNEPDLDPLKPETIEKIKNHHSIEAVGSQNDVRPWLAASDVFVFPSYREGFPNVVIEAGAMGLPSIVTDINGSREIIIDGKNGLIIPSHSVEAIYNAMQEVMDHDRRSQLSRSARNLIANRYEQSYVRDCLKKFYKEILS